VAERRRGGARSAPLPDFYIGAHAAAEKLDDQNLHHLVPGQRSRNHEHLAVVELVPAAVLR